MFLEFGVIVVHTRKISCACYSHEIAQGEDGMTYVGSCYRDSIGANLAAGNPLDGRILAAMR